MELKVRIKNVYGTNLIYPACNISQAIARVAGKKTFTDRDVTTLKGVGYTFAVEVPTL